MHTSRPALCGALARMIVASPGSVGQVSRRAITPPAFVMTRLCGANAGNTGMLGGVSTVGWPNCDNVALTFT